MLQQWRVVGAVFGVVALTGIAAASRIGRLEERDPFCVSCHTVPEATYFQRSREALAGRQPQRDLSSAHYGAEPGFRCIDCHRGDSGPLHRAGTLLLAARDTLIWLTGSADPRIERTDLVAPGLLAAACAHCHSQALLVAGFGNHYHNKLPQAVQALRDGGVLTRPPDLPDLPETALILEPADTGVLCVDCHRAHIHQVGAELRGYLDVAGVVYPACVRCHTDAGRGPLSLTGS